MKTKLIISALVILVAVVFSCKKTPEIPTISNKIEMGETIEDTTMYQNSTITSSVSTIAGNTITQHGHCWSINSEPTIENNHTSLGELSNPKSFTSELDSLEPNTKYYVRLYLNYSRGIIYGDEINITTLKTGIPVLTTSAATEITLTTAICGGNVSVDSGLVILTKGVCWDTTNSVNFENNIGITTDGDSLGAFTSLITELDEGANYFVVAYATNDLGTSYGDVEQFTTEQISLPVVTTRDISEITINSAVSGGNVISGGYSTVTSRGVCWNTYGNPTLENYFGHTINGIGIGEFTSIISGLTENTTYYVSAYATNEKGTNYGEINIFNTSELTLPEVNTANTTNVTSNSIISGGNVISNGNGIITARGVCWNNSSNPTLENNIGYIISGSGTGSFSSYISGLSANTQYYIRAYATNGMGTSYGNEIVVSTLSPPWQCGDQISYSGQAYNTVLIGTQCWMAENLNVGTMIPGSQYQTDNSEIEKYCYNDEPSNCINYGSIYLWDEMMQYTTTQGAQGICPTDWHIPTDEEWKYMEIHIGMSQIEADQTEWRGTDEGNKLKSTSGWYNNGNGTNSSSFSAFPSGYFQGWGELYLNIGEKGYWWSSNAGNPSSNAWFRNLSYDESKVYRSFTGKFNGMSVRCLKD